MNEKLIKISTAEAVVNYFKGRIKSGRLIPGDKLPSERQLQEILGVSRFSLREGLARLNALGLLRISQGKGAFVSGNTSAQSLENVLIPMTFSQDEKTLEDLMEARATIEGEIAAKAAQCCTDEDLDRLTAILDRSEAGLDDPISFGRLDFEFHRALGQICPNRFYRLMTDALSDSVDSFLRAHARPMDNRQEAAQSHRQILDAVRKRDVETARELTRRHIHRCKANYKKHTHKKDTRHDKPSL